MLNFYHEGDGSYSEIAKKCLKEYDIVRSSTVSITMHEGHFPTAYSFDFSKFYWHVVSKVIKTHFPTIFKEINDEFYKIHSEIFPLELPSAEQKFKINSFIGCLSSQYKSINPFSHTKFGTLIRKLGFTTLELVIKTFERDYQCKIIGAQTDGFYFLCNDTNFERLQSNFQHPFAFKIEKLNDLYASEKTWYWTTNNNTIDSRGAVRRLFSMINGEYCDWCIISDDDKKLKIKMFVQHDLDLNRWMPETKKISQGKFINFYRDENLFSEIIESFKTLTPADKIYFATELASTLEEVFFDAKTNSYIINDDYFKQVQKKVYRICKKVIVLEDKTVRFDRVDVKNFQIIKRSFFIDELFDKYININQVKKNSIISAPTGSGKSFSMCNYLKEHCEKGCIVEPTKSIAQQIMFKYGINYLKSSNYEEWDGDGDLNDLQTFSYSNNFIDKFLKKTIFADEMHANLWFKEYYDRINLCIFNGTGVTATVPPLYNFISKTYSYYSLREKNAKVKFHMMQMESKESIVKRLLIHILDNIKKGVKSFLYYDDKDVLQCIKNELNKCSINDVIIYARSVIDQTEDGELGFNSTAEYVEAAATGSHRVVLSTLRGITGVDFTYDNLNTIIFSKDVLNTVQACSRDRIAPNCDVYMNCHYAYNDGDKLYTYYIDDGMGGGFDHDKNLMNQLNSSAKYFDVLVSLLKANGFEDLHIVKYDAPAKIAREGLKKSEVIDHAANFYTTGASAIDDVEVERKFINNFNVSSKKYKHNLKIKINFKQLFTLFKESFDEVKADIEYSSTNKVIKTTNIFTAIAIKVLNMKVEKFKMVRTDRTKWNKFYPRDFVKYIEKYHADDLPKWKKKWSQTKKNLYFDLYKEEFENAVI